MSKVAPPPKLTVTQWAELKRRLSSESSAEPGRFSTARAPYQRAIMDAITDPRVEMIVFKSSSQVGKTEIMLNMIGYFVEHDPAPMLIVMPDLNLAEAFSKDRLAPMIRDTPSLFKIVGVDGKMKKSGDTILHKKFPGGHITIAGSNSPASLASRPVRFVLCDEIDRFSRSAGVEGDPVNLALKRSQTFVHNKKSILISTPTIKKISKIDKAYEASDQRKLYVPCPHCGHFQILRWEQVKFQNEDYRTAEYICEECSAVIDESEKAGMLTNGEFRAHSEFDGIAGFELNELYSPWSTWRKIAKDFFAAKDDPESLKTWVNTSLGQSYEQKGDAPEWRRLYDRRENYKIGTIPKGGVFLTGALDVQKDRIEFEAIAWGRNKESWSVDYRVIPFDTSDEKMFREKINEILAEKWTHANGSQIPLKVLAVDSGYRSQTVYSVCRKYPRTRVLVIKGSDTCASVLGSPKKIDVKADGKTYRRSLLLWPVGSSKAKEEIYGWLEAQKPTDEELEHSGGKFPFGFCHFPEYDEEYFKMLTAEELVMKVIKHKTYFEWVKVRDRNEALDLRVYNRAAASFVGIDRFKEEHWAREEAAMAAQPSIADQAEGNIPKRPPRKRRDRSRSSGSIW